MNITDTEKGLTQAQAEERAARGESNGSLDIKTKSIRQIFRENIFTLFNAINIVLAAAVAIAGSWRNMLFMGVVVCNIAIGIFQQIRSKRVIDRLSLISAPKAHLLRDGIERELPVCDIVKDDIMLLCAGRQVCADGVVLSGECEADESLVTGENEPVPKKSGDELLSGSFIVAGSVKAQAVRVGAESFSGKITGGAKYVRKQSSEMMKSINKIISVISVCIVPLGIALLAKSLFITQQTPQRGITSTVAALVGMIPEGLVLLTSIALAVSAIRLGRSNMLCQDLYCVESLARVDVLCLDKTGTITEGCMQVEEVIAIDEKFDVENALSALCSAFTDPNPTLRAIQDKFGSKTTLKPISTIPFSSARKYSAVCFESYGTVALGAAGFMLKDTGEQLSERIREFSERGMRVLLVGYSPLPCGEELPQDILPKALVILSDKIRESAPQTLAYFKEQGVAIKVISGDDPATVSCVAARAGLEGAECAVDMSAVPDEGIAEAAEKYTVFARVTPCQKSELVKALKAVGHKVAMTGDGVNDVLALREADCSVAMQSGSDAARSVSQLVLLDSDFASMPLAVQEGRRVINNIQRSAALFLTKTIMSALLTVLFLILPCAYPLQPIQMTLISAITIGIPSFILALEPNRSIVKGSFLRNVMMRAAPGGITAAADTALLAVCQIYLDIPQEQVSTMSTLLIAAVGFGVLWNVCKPLKLWRTLMFIGLAALFAAMATLFGELFYLVPLTAMQWLILGILASISWLILGIISTAACRRSQIGTG